MDYSTAVFKFWHGQVGENPSTLLGAGKTAFLKISKIAKFKSDLLKTTSEIKILKSQEILQTFVW